MGALAWGGGNRATLLGRWRKQIYTKSGRKNCIWINLHSAKLFLPGFSFHSWRFYLFFQNIRSSYKTLAFALIAARRRKRFCTIEMPFWRREKGLPLYGIHGTKMICTIPYPILKWGRGVYCNQGVRGQPGLWLGFPWKPGLFTREADTSSPRHNRDH